MNHQNLSPQLSLYSRAFTICSFYTACNLSSYSCPRRVQVHFSETTSKKDSNRDNSSYFSRHNVMMVSRCVAVIAVASDATKYEQKRQVISFPFSLSD